MTALYWIFEYVKVFLIYGFLMFVWPSVVFRKQLRGKSFSFRFAFCVTTQVVIINTIVIGLGLLHILNPWVFCFLFYGSLIGSIFYKVRIKEQHVERLKRLVTGTYGRKTFHKDMLDAWRRKKKEWNERLHEALKGHIWEYLLLGVVVVFGMIYFTYGAFQDYSYGFGDMYPHNAWIYGLTDGQIFSAGVYPEGMHCFVYTMHTLFGVRIYSCMMFTAGIHSGVFIISAYLLLREVFRSRYTPLLALTLFMTIDVQCIDEIYSMSRLQWTIPQEFGFYTVFLCGTFLLRYLKAKEKSCQWKGKLFRKGFWDANLYIFMMSIAASLVIHFYDTIMAFFLCVAFVPLAVHIIFRPKRLGPLVASVAIGVFIAVVPMGGALASGIPFQGSIGWAMNVINGVDGQSADSQNADGQSADGQSSDGLGNDGQNGNGQNAGAQGIQNSDSRDTTGEEAVEAPKLSLTEKVANYFTESIDRVYRQCYATLYKRDRADLILMMTLVGFLIWVFCKAVTVALHFLQKAKAIDICAFDGYFGLILAGMIYTIMYYSKAVGLPSLVAGSRLCSIGHLLLCAMVFIPIDLILFALGCFVWRSLMKVVATVGIWVVYYIVGYTGNFHGYLYYELTRYNSAVMATYEITKMVPKQQFTIVSTVDELYQVVQYGFHEELVQFVNNVMKEDYTIPTPYVFLYVEKKPLEYAQSHFFEGPDWLALERYPEYYHSYVSQCPDITVSQINEEDAKNRSKVKVHSSMYSKLESRTMIESRLYDWCREFEKLYPHELQVYYEDDDFVCYYFKQNPFRLFQLGIH